MGGCLRRPASLHRRQNSFWVAANSTVACPSRGRESRFKVRYLSAGFMFEFLKTDFALSNTCTTELNAGWRLIFCATQQPQPWILRTAAYSWPKPKDELSTFAEVNNSGNDRFWTDHRMSRIPPIEMVPSYAQIHKRQQSVAILIRPFAFFIERDI